MGGFLKKNFIAVLVSASGLLVICLIAAVMFFLPTKMEPTEGDSANQPVDFSKIPEALLPISEIPINEYWAFGKIGDLSLYVNNTDRGVIYALDKNGKIVWQVLGADYGFPGSGKIGYGSYQIRLNSDHLFVTRTSEDKLKNDWTTLWVFDGAGKLKWTNNFYGYLDMPLMLVTPQRYVVLQNRNWSVPAETGCGVMCTKDSSVLKNESAVSAFDLNTGKIIWKNTSPIGGRFVYNEKRKSLDVNGNCDKSDYTVDIENGTITSYERGILCFRNKANSFARLAFVPASQSVQVQQESGQQWTFVSRLENKDLYQYIKGIAAEGSTFYGCTLGVDAIACESSNQGAFSLDVFSLNTGKRFWTLNNLESRPSLLTTRTERSGMNKLEVDGKLFVEIFPKYDCAQYCNAPCTTFVCEDKGAESEPAACMKCARDYSMKGELRAYNINSGELLWVLVPGSDVGYSFQEDAETLSPGTVVQYINANYYEYKNNKNNLVASKKIDLNTGKEIK
jgi:outer membrane protein assembly factor BamB